MSVINLVNEVRIIEGLLYFLRVLFFLQIFCELFLQNFVTIFVLNALPLFRGNFVQGTQISTSK